MLQKNKETSHDNQKIATRPMKVSVSDLSTYYQYNCDKLLQLKRRNSTKKDYTSKIYDSLSEAPKHRGNKFESDIKNSLHNVVDCKDKSPNDAKKLLRKAENGQIFYQMKFNVPEEFYKYMDIKKIFKLKAFTPSFIEVKEENGMKTLMVYDTNAPQFQVASYVYLLEFVIQEIPGFSISHVIGIYFPSSLLQEPFQLQTFRIDFLLPQIKRFFREKLPAIATTEGPWHYNSRCKTCDFVDTCRKDADGTIAMIPYLSLEKAVYLKNLIKPGKDNVEIEDLAKYFEKFNIDNENSDQAANTMIKQITKYDKKSNSSPYLKAIETKQAQFIGSVTANFPQKTDHNLLIAMTLDPFLSRPLGWGICLYNGDGSILESFAESISKDDESQESFTSLMNQFVTTLADCFEMLAGERSQACVFVYSEREKTTIQNALLKIITMDKGNSSALQHTAMRCFFNLFDSTSLLASAEDDKDDVMGEWKEFPRLIILEHAIKENIAIHVPGFYRFIDIWQQLVKPNLNDQELLDSLEQHIEKINLEDIYDLWDSAQISTQQINEAHILRIKFGSAVIKAYYELLKESTNKVEDILIFSPPIFNFTEIKDFKHDYLGKLYFFKYFEAIAECVHVKSDRMRDFAQDETVRGIRLRFKDSVNKEGSEWVVNFTILSNEKKVNLEGTNKQYEFILVEDNLEGILKAIRFPDMKYRDKFPHQKKSSLKDKNLSVVCIHSSDPQNETINLKGFKRKLTGSKVTTYRLYKRYINFNLNKVITMLGEMDERSDNNSLKLLKNPKEWGFLTEEVENFEEIKSKALKLRKDFSMSPSQEKISENLLARRLQIIWGPPGSGKTHFLALFTTWYLSAFIPSIPNLAGTNKNYVIGVTAFTKNAAVNLLERISRIQKEHNKMDDFIILSLIKNLKKEPLNVLKECEIRDLPKRMEGNNSVIGGTVWDWCKVRKYNPIECDIMIIDEGSQLLVSDAILAIECLNPITGKLIVAGDHKQLGPIIQNSYPAFSSDHPLIFGSIQQCLMRRKDGSIFHEEDLKGHDFEPLTTQQLEENWRMNEELNGFFQKIYGNNYISKDPNRKLGLDDQKLSQINDPLIKKILSPDSAITLVKLKSKKSDDSSNMLSDKFLQAEADVVEKITLGYISSLKDTEVQKLFIVTPYHKQRLEIQSRLKDMNKRNINLQINTVDKIQGQEADIVISCFGFSNLSKGSKFLFDINRWNVALSRAKSKAIIITTDEMLKPDDIEILTNKKISGGLEFLLMVKKWVKEKAIISGSSGGKRRREKDNGVIEWIIDDGEKRQKNEEDLIDDDSMDIDE